MFCPKCSQPQVSDEVRFCVRCGFQLDGVKILLTTDGMPIQQSESNQPVSKWNKPGVKIGTKLMFLSMILFPIFLGFGFFDKELLIFILVPKTIFLIGLFWMLYSRIFGESPVQSNKLNLNATNTQTHTLSQNKPPKSLHAQPINTAEMMPQSVTENTTKLLEQK